MQTQALVPSPSSEHPLFLSSGRARVGKQRKRPAWGGRLPGHRLHFRPWACGWLRASGSLHWALEGTDQRQSRTAVLCADPVKLPPLGESLMDVHPGQTEVRLWAAADGRAWLLLLLLLARPWHHPLPSSLPQGALRPVSEGNDYPAWHRQGQHRSVQGGCDL